MRAKKPSFSIVIPVYNRSDSILPTLYSVSRQTFNDFECIVVDDGSDDGVKLAEAVYALNDHRFKYVRQQNAGGGAARNTGVQVSQGEYIAFLDSDDLFLPEKLAVFYATVEPKNELTAYYSSAHVDRGGRRYWTRPDRPIGHAEDMGEYLFVHNQYIQTSTMVIPRRLLLRIGFDPRLRRGQDLDLCIKLANAGVRFTMIDKPLVIWTDRSEVNRTSRVGSYHEPMKWLENNANLLNQKAAAGYRATVLAYFIAPYKPWAAATYLWHGFHAGVPFTILLRQVARSYLPRQAYRRLINLLVDLSGQRKERT